MPIFTSRFSSNRVAGASLQRVRTQANQTVERVQTGQTRQTRNTSNNRQTAETQSQRQTERTQNTDRTETTSRAEETERSNLLARSQRAESLAERLQNRRTNGRSEATAQTATESATTPTQQERSTQTQRTQVEPARPERQPGVGTVRTRADNDVERPGRLSRTPANPVREQQLTQFASLRSAARGGNTRQADDRAQNRGQTDVPGLNRQVDGRIRLLASNIRGRQNAPGLAARQEIGQANETPTATVPPQAATLATTATQPAPPSAEDISRANTTPEIQENLQQDTREVAQGLSRDAIRQTQANTQRFAQNSERAAENQSEAVQRESQREVRQLQTQERELERDLQQTQQDIRSQRGRAQRATSAASSSTSSAAAAIGSGFNILAG